MSSPQQNQDNSNNIIQFDILECQKENIQPLMEGRSASALARAFAIPPAASPEIQEELTRKRDEFEDRIARSTAELDDPIEPYLEYISWINDTFPQGGNNPTNGIVQVLERCTSEFRDAPYYKDDPRYLKVWLRYITFSDSPREIFLYLARKEIGKNLASFYEEYAKYLEVNGLRRQAKETYEIGIELMARPLERLRRHYLEFCQRLEANPIDPDEPESSSGLQMVRPALAVKDSSTSEPVFEQTSTSTRSSIKEGFGGGLLSSKKKLAVYTDPDDQHSGSSTIPSAGGWDTLDSISSRRKENVIKASPWVGQTIKSAKPVNSNKQNKIPIFRDSSSGNNGYNQPVPVPGRRNEIIAVALEFLHDEYGEEYCLEEVLARARGLLHKSYPRDEEEKPAESQENKKINDNTTKPISISSAGKNFLDCKISYFNFLPIIILI